MDVTMIMKSRGVGLYDFGLENDDNKNEEEDDDNEGGWQDGWVGWPAKLDTNMSHGALHSIY